MSRKISIKLIFYLHINDNFSKILISHYDSLNCCILAFKAIEQEYSSRSQEDESSEPHIQNEHNSESGSSENSSEEIEFKSKMRAMGCFHLRACDILGRSSRRHDKRN